MYLLDTNICIALIQGDSRTVEAFNRRREDCYLSTIVLAELYKGVYCSQRVEQNSETLRQFAKSFEIVPFNSASAIEFGKIQAELRLIGKPTGNLNAAIAAVARSRQDVIVTTSFDL